MKMSDAVVHELANLVSEGAILTSTEAARIAGYTADHICLLARNKRLLAEKKGRDWLIAAKSLNEYLKTEPKPGRKRH
jgi:hypothetical protein